MSGRYDSLKKHLVEHLSRASASYLKSALARCHDDPRAQDAEAQAAIGQAGVAVELMLKALAAAANPGLLFKDIPLEAKVFFHAPDELPAGFNWTPFDLDLREFAYDTISFDEAVRTFYALFPERKRDLRTYFKALSELRVLSVRAALVKVQRAELEKSVYLALQVADILSAREPAAYAPTDRDRKLLKAYDEERARRVREKTKAAKEKAGALKVDISFNEPPGREGWDAFETRCPVCKNWGFLAGWTEIRCEADGSEHLDFFADSFDCDACSLLLDDSEEMKASDMPTLFDRTEDLARWREDVDSREEEK